LFGAGDVNVFEHTLEPVVAKVPAIRFKTRPGGNGRPQSTRAKKRSQTFLRRRPAPNAKSAATTEGIRFAFARRNSQERILAGLVGLLPRSASAPDGLFRQNRSKMPKILEDKWRIDELYNGYIVDPLTNISRNGLWKGFDVGVY
jgi:hypothetical protein